MFKSSFLADEFLILRHSLVSSWQQFFGGTNFGRTSGGPFYVTSYDYDAPIDEYGALEWFTTSFCSDAWILSCLLIFHLNCVGRPSQPA